MLIGVISDTHIPNRAEKLPKEVLLGLKKTDLIIHAGDICEGWVLNELKSIAPVKAVFGNTDGEYIQKILPKREVVNIKSFKIGIIHGDGGRRRDTIKRVMDAFKDDGVNCIIFGHTHRAYNRHHGNILLFNPGSPTNKRKSSYFSYGQLTIEETINGRIFYF